MKMHFKTRVIPERTLWISFKAEAAAKAQSYGTHSAHDIDDGGRAVGFLAVVDSRLLADQRPQLIQVNGGAEESVPLQVVMSHAHLTEITRMTAGNKHQSTLTNKTKKK